MNRLQFSQPEANQTPFTDRWWAIGWLFSLGLVHCALVWQQFHLGDEGAFIVECQFCLLAILLVFGGFRIEVRWGLVLLTYLYFQLFVFIAGRNLSELFSGKQAAVFALALLLSLVMRLIVLPMLGWRPALPRFKLYDMMIGISVAFIWMVIWNENLSFFCKVGLPGRSWLDVMLQIALSTWGAVAVVLPVLSINNNLKHLEVAIGLWLAILIVDVFAAGWSYTTFGHWSHAPLGICIGNEVWTTIAVGCTLTVLIYSLERLGLNLLHGQDS